MDTNILLGTCYLTVPLLFGLFLRSLLCSNLLLYYFNIFFCLFSCFACFAFYLVHSLFLYFCVLFLPLYIVYFLFMYKFTNYCHWVETQLQLINIIIINILLQY